MDVEFLKYQYEDAHDGIVVKSKFKLGVRHIQMIYMFVCAFVMGTFRGSIGIAVLAMTDEARQNDTYIKIHDNWDKIIQGTVLSSFFIGHALALVPADLILRRIDGKAALTIILLVNGALSFTLPTIINRGGWIATCNALFMMGMTQACLAPATQLLISKWLPPTEKNTCSRVVYGGVLLGIIVALPVSGIISEARLGWELVMYSLGMLAVSCGAVCCLFTASTPKNHQAIGDAEVEFLERALSFYRKKNLPVPWRRVLKTREFWAVACAHAACSAIFVFYLVAVPAFLKVLNASLKDCAIYTVLPFVTMWAMYVTTSPTFDWLSRLGYVAVIANLSYFRKLINAMGAFGMAIGLTILPNLVPDWSNFVIIVLTATLGLAGLQLSGFLKTLTDMSENFSGTLFVMSSGIASIAGAVTPLATGLILGDNEADLKRWKIAFLSLASFCVVCNVIYTVFASSERQEWDEVRKRKIVGYHNVSNQIQLEDLSHKKLNADSDIY
ncbi:putative inorganic phosphate cotransporter [Ostrinia furnacalis]|uniref:putative inorganic phosphate cotransporter n=1 Tax=Ostrinia furnacalis TaxID=93504 RepID=UPI0010407F53|nr:putative inorganic phosphate cotransporter [Ostrinia furnacalis]